MASQPSLRGPGFPQAVYAPVDNYGTVQVPHPFPVDTAGLGLPPPFLGG
jgi:hypothetical protein